MGDQSAQKQTAMVRGKTLVDVVETKTDGGRTSVQGTKLLRDVDWAPSYSHEDGDLVDLFFLPALSCSRLYQRVTGYFNKEALSLASRGLDTLIRNEGRMELIVGCTLEQEEVDAIEAGHALRTLIEKGIHKRLKEIAATQWEKERLGWLSWMVAHGHLDIKVAIPKDADGKYRAGSGLYHVKAGLLVDSAGEKLVFRGSINETLAGWKRNCESFDVSCSWRGEWDLRRVRKSEDEFRTLWANQSKSAEVMDVPEAVKEDLMQYMPADDSFLRPDAPIEPEPELPQDTEPTPPELETSDGQQVEDEELLSVDERRKQVWSFIRNAAKRSDGALVGIQTSTVEPWPHQLRAYKRMLDAWPVRMLIADEVGLGKTIEAGILIRHAWMSELAKRILIMVPKAIMKQWQAELYEKFNLVVPIYTGQSFVWPEHHFRQGPLDKKVPRDKWTDEPMVLVSSHLMRRKERQGELLEAEDWDLIVLDEAHHARRRGAGTAQERGPNRLLALMQGIRDKAKSLILMTATPMQVHPVELWDLLNILGLPSSWTEAAFDDYFATLASNPDKDGLARLANLYRATEAEFGPIDEGQIEQVTSTLALSKIDRTKILNALREKTTTIPLKKLSTKQRKGALAILQAGSPVRFLMSRHTRGLLREYASRGMLDSPIAEREISDIAVQMTSSEKELYGAVEEHIRSTYQAATANKRNAVGFVMTVYRRRVASSFHALRKTLESKLARLDSHEDIGLDDLRLEEDVSQDEFVDEVTSADEAADMEAEALQFEERESIQALLKAIAKLGTDSKALRLVKELESVAKDGYEGAIIFTQYAATMEYLKEFLGDRIDLPMGCYSGDGGQRRGPASIWTSCTKEETKRLLRTGEIKLLVCTEAAGEGLNLQSCGVLVNFDLPWNPMKVEQRIGRIDRIGQKHPVVKVINLGYADTVEVDVYFALSKRIDLFRGVVGKLQPILSRLPKEFEKAALGEATGDAQARHLAVSHVDAMVSEAENADFDIDAVSEADLEPPRFPESPLSLADFDRVLHQDELLPPGFECEELERYTYALRIPGQRDAARVTSSPAIFDEHFESHQLLLPDSPLFRVVASAAGAEDTNEAGEISETLQDLM